MILVGIAILVTVLVIVVPVVLAFAAYEQWAKRHPD